MRGQDVALARRGHLVGDGGHVVLGVEGGAVRLLQAARRPLVDALIVDVVYGPLPVLGRYGACVARPALHRLLAALARWHARAWRGPGLRGAHTGASAPAEASGAKCRWLHALCTLQGNAQRVCDVWTVASQRMRSRKRRGKGGRVNMNLDCRGLRTALSSDGAGLRRGHPSLQAEREWRKHAQPRPIRAPAGAASEAPRQPLRRCRTI